MIRKYPPGLFGLLGVMAMPMPVPGGGPDRSPLEVVLEKINPKDEPEEPIVVPEDDLPPFTD